MINFDFTLVFIYLCFAIMALFWISQARKTKPTAEHRGGWWMRITAIVLVVAVILTQQIAGKFWIVADVSLWSHALGVRLLADFVALSGLVIMTWARIALNDNWSANVVLKENHKLITSGPYAYVRHPIYSGLLLMILSLVIYYANWSAVLLFFIFFFGAYFGKGRREEQILTEKFPEEYPAYRRRVKALIPFIF
jgi:protein-S-isoprenylcysteine O-methyltransferase Ste14